MKIKLIVALTSIGLLLGGFWYWHAKKNKNLAIGYKQEIVVVEAAPVSEGNIDIQARSVGSLVAAKNVHIIPEVEGKVAAILANDGTFVKQNTPLIQLDDTVIKAKAASAKANLIYSESNYKRMLLLGKKGAVTQQAIDQALADLIEKKSAAKETSVLVDKMLLKAPFDGMLGKIKVNPGEYVSVGQQVVSLTDTKNLRVEYTVSEKFFGLVKLGQQVNLTTTAFPGKQFYGKVAFISPTINTQDRTISIYADVPNQDGQLMPGLFMNVVHLLGTENKVLLIPSVSLVATIDGQQVYKIVNNKAVSVAVQIGQRTENQVQITQGLNLKDSIVISGQHKLKDGTVVQMKT